MTTRKSTKKTPDGIGSKASLMELITSELQEALHSGYLDLLSATLRELQEWYFKRFPRIAKWQENFRANLTATHTVRNAFGYRRHFFERIDGQVFNKAAAWIPQSTVALAINKAWDQIKTAEPEIRVLLQVHDSLAIQYPIARRDYYRERLRQLSRVVIPYPKPLVIPTGFKYSTKSWGDCE